MAIKLEWAQFSKFDSMSVYRSTSSIDTENLPTPLATGLTTMYYFDSTAVDGETYYYVVGMWLDGVEYLSAEISITAEVANADQYFDLVDYLVLVDGGNIVDKSNNNRAITNVGGVTVSGGEMIFNGSSHLELSTTDLAGKSFTIEWFQTRSTGDGAFRGVWQANSGGYYPLVGWNGGVVFGQLTSVAQLIASYSNTGNKEHWCLMYDLPNQMTYLAVDGVIRGSMTYNLSLSTSTSAKIGRGKDNANAAGLSDFLGSIQALRCTLGTLRYDVTGFTPPTEFPTS